jgi:hypothetical protein
VTQKRKNIPPILSIDTALRLYHLHGELGNKEIEELFGKLSSSTISKLKKLVVEEMEKRNVQSYGLYKVNTVVAYDVWGLAIIDLEIRRNSLKMLGM